MKSGNSWTVIALRAGILLAAVGGPGCGPMSRPATPDASPTPPTVTTDPGPPPAAETTSPTTLAKIRLDVTVTPRAAEAVRRAIREAGGTGDNGRPLFLRFRIRGSACDGFQNHLDLDSEIGPDDLRLETQGIILVADRRSALFGTGAVIDYIDSPGKRGFSITNPNAKPVDGGDGKGAGQVKD